ncbi:hypothetical protein DVH24_034561 [Malus domestica]|uniref:Retrotransposon Copia-like N-terminal domain-containing protein n=1 Tax=Malus domestica TaxID=3750 RepID=A0A498J2K4_MALDO|nr:hypothetical protein DVH24_034561 [Malus domestica]
MTTVVNIKLDRTNYPLWLAQILHILKSRDLMGHVDGTLVCPLKNMSGVATVKPVYTSWMQQDQWLSYCVGLQENCSSDLGSSRAKVVMMIMPNLIQRLRSLMGLKGWDCCVLWKLSEDQRLRNYNYIINLSISSSCLNIYVHVCVRAFIELSDCCCARTEITQSDVGQELFP